MTTLTSTQPGAHDALLALIESVAAVQSPVVQVFDTFLLPANIPPIYVILFGTSKPDEQPDHEFEVAALGSFAFYETYTFYGEVRYAVGNVDPQTARDSAWSVFNAVVMAPIVENRGFGGTPVISSSAPSQLEYIKPTYARPSVLTGEIGGGQAGTQAVVEWAFELMARIEPA